MMALLLTRRRVRRLAGFASVQVLVQGIGFVAGIVLVRHLEQVDYGHYTLALAMVGMANVLSELGLSTAVLAEGGRLARQPRELGALLADARALQRRLALWVLLPALPLFALMLWQQLMPPWQALLLSTLVLTTSACQVRSALALSMLRLLGQAELQQRLDLAMNLVKLLFLAAAMSLLLDAVVACLINLGAALATLAVLQRQLDARIGLPAAPSGRYAEPLWSFVRRQAPNTVWFCLGSQLALWLIGLFGDAKGVAELGALGRLGALFALIGAVMAALVQPYFAGHHRSAELRSGFVAVNLFFGTLAAALLLLALAVPQALLWILGPRYAGLDIELAWMVAATALAAWGGALYAVGCARGWVLPARWAVSSGMVASVLLVSWVDVSTAAGGFMLNTGTALTGLVVVGVYVHRELRRLARAEQAAGMGVDGGAGRDLA